MWRKRRKVEQNKVKQSRVGKTCVTCLHIATQFLGIFKRKCSRYTTFNNKLMTRKCICHLISLNWLEAEHFKPYVESDFVEEMDILLLYSLSKRKKSILHLFIKYLSLLLLTNRQQGLINKLWYIDRKIDFYKYHETREQYSLSQTQNYIFLSYTTLCQNSRS